FQDVAGVEEAKEELREIVEFLRTPKKFLSIGARIPKGVLLMGPPGAGKTLLARAVAGEAGVPFFHMSAAEFVEMLVGVGASRVRDLFKMAKKAAPAIIFIDEIDAVGRHRGAGLGGGHDEREQTLNQILVELDGFEPHESVIVMAATNRPDVLDPALLRPGRFDRRVVLDLPDIKAREAILKIHAKGKPLVKEVELRRVAERTPGFSGADLQNLMNEGAILAARKNEKQITQHDLLISIEKVMLGPERKSHILSPKEKKISAYHEAGHALVAAVMPEADPVHKVSIISRGRAAGYTLKIPIEDRHLYSKAHFLAELAVALGGYAAEKTIFSEITTGASNDLKQATAVARDMVTKYGMSEKVGPINLGDNNEMVFLGRELGSERHYSEKMASAVDGEVSRFMQDAFKKATEIIKKHKNILEAITKHLIEKETIERNEFDNLVQSFGLPLKTATPQT
ncbi:MAG: ATP-dependent zinc metalloprotease FtsH, partial [Patescibacteria group bacterium]